MSDGAEVQLDGWNPDYQRFNSADYFYLLWGVVYNDEHKNKIYNQNYNSLFICEEIINLPV